MEQFLFISSVEHGPQQAKVDNELIVPPICYITYYTIVLPLKLHRAQQ
jgi:hypothetical protein